VFLEEGFTRIVYGLFKKSVIADLIDYIAASSWNNIAERT
jgi:D-alanyl-lipoteichoic acid acyltransferase DltB (MBOAT superfamily)